MFRASTRSQFQERHILFIAWGVALLTLFLALILFSIFRPVTVSFLDVGHGDSCLIQAGDDGNVLIDGGDEGQGESILSFLKIQNVSKLNAVFISHFHEDHVNGILELLDLNFPIDRFYASDYPSQTSLEDKLLSKAKEKGIPVFRLRAGEEIKLGKACYQVIYQEPLETEEDLNNMSMVLKMTYGSSSILFTGDLEKDAAKRLIAQSGTEIKADILKIPHHGGVSSLSEEMVSLCNPNYAVVSVGESAYGNPSSKVLSCFAKREIPVYRTDRDGTIIITLGKNRIKNITLGKIGEIWR